MLSIVFNFYHHLVSNLSYAIYDCFNIFCRLLASLLICMPLTNEAHLKLNLLNFQKRTTGKKLSDKTGFTFDSIYKIIVIKHKR